MPPLPPPRCAPLPVPLPRQRARRHPSSSTASGPPPLAHPALPLTRRRLRRGPPPPPPPLIETEGRGCLRSQKRSQTSAASRLLPPSLHADILHHRRLPLPPHDGFGALRHRLPDLRVPRRHRRMDQRQSRWCQRRLSGQKTIPLPQQLNGSTPRAPYDPPDDLSLYEGSVCGGGGDGPRYDDPQNAPPLTRAEAAPRLERRDGP